MQFETFSVLNDIPFIRHAFTLRTDQDTKSDSYPDHVVASLGFTSRRVASAEQPHGARAAIVTGPGHVPAVDALATRIPELPLLVRCADCAAVYIVDRTTPAIALIHSGKRGTMSNITGNTVAAMRDGFGTRPADCVAFISPCIGPCHYEMDLWHNIETQLRHTGMADIHNPRICTGCHLDRYFSYRVEKGHTGRMFALLSLNDRS